MKIVYSFNKKGYEARYWETEIRAASDERFIFIPFNHDLDMDWRKYARAQLLDNLYYARDPALMELYRGFEHALSEHRADAVIVDNFAPYHPDFLRTINVYKVLRTSDGPVSAYDRDFAYLHAYDHILYHSPAYSRDMGMAEKLRYCGAKNIDFWPLALFDACFDNTKTPETLFGHERDIDIIFIGTQHLDKLPLLATVKRAFGRRFKLFGIASFKKNVYFNLRHNARAWVRTAPFEKYVPLYQRAKIGINVHNRGKYTVGSYRLFELPGNGVMQISDGGEYLSDFFEVGSEIVGYEAADELIDKLHYYLLHDEERQAIALRGYQRVMRSHRLAQRMREAAEMIDSAMGRTGCNYDSTRVHRRINGFGHIGLIIDTDAR
jgi:hypothetical protein